MRTTYVEEESERLELVESDQLVEAGLLRQLQGAAAGLQAEARHLSLTVTDRMQSGLVQNNTR